MLCMTKGTKISVSARTQPIYSSDISLQNLPVEVLCRLVPEWMGENRDLQTHYLACGQPFGNLDWLEDITFLATEDTEPVLLTGTNAQNIAMIDSCFWPVGHDSVRHLLIHHGFVSLDRPDTFIEEAVRVLEPAGTMLFICPYRRWYWTPKIVKFRASVPADRLLTRAQIISLVTSAGLDIVQMRHSRYKKPPSIARRSRFSRLVGTGRHQQNSVLLIQARKRLYAPHKANYAYSRRRFGLGKMVPAGLATNSYTELEQ